MYSLHSKIVAALTHKRAYAPSECGGAGASVRERSGERQRERAVHLFVEMLLRCACGQKLYQASAGNYTNTQKRLPSSISASPQCCTLIWCSARSPIVVDSAIIVELNRNAIRILSKHNCFAFGAFKMWMHQFYMFLKCFFFFSVCFVCVPLILAALFSLCSHIHSLEVFEFQFGLVRAPRTLRCTSTFFSTSHHRRRSI